MRLIRDEPGISALCRSFREEGLKVGFVPTMGALHEGHLSLVKRARENSDRVVVSIFVNPTQFGEGEDLGRYPRTLEEDCGKLQELGVAAVFAPEPEVIYHADFATGVSVSGLTAELCGRYRTGHFDGVTTVCAVLFGIVRPHLAVFGRKDAQQLAVIRRMVKDLRLDLEIDEAPIVREPDGLAMSSRNAYLLPEERRQASAVFRGLCAALAMHAEGETDCRKLREAAEDEIRAKPLLHIQYIETVDPDTLQGVEMVREPVLLAAAVFAGRTRLIDNVLIQPEE